MSKSKKELSKELEEIKSKLGKRPVFEVETYLYGLDEEKRTLFFKRPDRLTRTAAEQLIGKDKTSAAMETVARGCYLGGDNLDEVLNEDEAFFTLCNSLVELIRAKEGKIARA